MTPRAYYNEFEPGAVHVLRHLIKIGVLLDGDVDTRSIEDVQPEDLRGYTQHHFFAGGGIWQLAARLAGWPDERPLWTGSCPCQPYSAAGKGLGADDPRHLWPDFFRLIRSFRPPVVVGEQVAGAPGYGWFDGVRADLESENYAGRAVDIPACAVDAPHIRQRLYWAATLGVPTEEWDAGRIRWSSRLSAGVRFDSKFVGIFGDRFGARLEGHARDGNGSGGRTEASGPASASNGGVRAESVGTVVNATRERRGEGGTEHELRRGRSAPAGSDVSIRLADRDGKRRDGRAGSSGNQSGISESTHCDDRADDGDMAYADQSLRRIGDQQSAGQLPVDEQDAGIYLRPGSGDVSIPNSTFWSDAYWLECADGKARRAKSGIRFLVDGLPGRVGLWRIGGNAIVAPLAVETLKALLDVTGRNALFSRCRIEDMDEVSV